MSSHSLRPSRSNSSAAVVPPSTSIQNNNNNGSNYRTSEGSSSGSSKSSSDRSSVVMTDPVALSSNKEGVGSLVGSNGSLLRALDAELEKIEIALNENMTLQ
jgi:hypothetical protein